MVISLVSKCTQDSHRLTETVLSLAKRNTQETSSSSPGNSNSSGNLLSDTEVTEKSDESYPCGELAEKPSPQSLELLPRCSRLVLL